MRFLKWLIVGIGGLIMAAAEISPQDAASNLSAWVEWLGLETPLWLLSDSADKFGLAIGFIMAALGFAAIMGWGTSTTVHLSRPYFRCKPSDNESYESEEPNRMCLSEATLVMYEETQGLDIANVADAFGEGDVRSFYMKEISENIEIRIFGRREPSRVWVEIPATEVRHFTFCNNANDLVGIRSRDSGYTDLKIEKGEFERGLEYVKGWKRG
jgi:hypothetical protein